jgi:ectoine hydroxylase-related dioxygenase (phytanoyl-CoA dioxygenase family)
MVQDHVSQFRNEGYTVVRGVFSPDEVGGLAAAFDRIHARAVADGRNWRDRNTYFCLADDPVKGRILRYVQWPGWIDETLERARRDPRILEILEPLIGRNLKQIINQMHWKAPGASAEFGFHQDSRSRRPREAYRDLANSYIQTGIAIDPHSIENGAMVVCPESHLQGALPFDAGQRSMDQEMNTADLSRFGLRSDRTAVLRMEPGDLALWHVNTLHGSGPNRSAIDRRFYINGYVIAENCDRGEWAFRDGEPCPLKGEQSLVHYEELHSNPGPMYLD